MLNEMSLRRMCVKRKATMYILCLLCVAGLFRFRQNQETQTHDTALHRPGYRRQAGGPAALKDIASDSEMKPSINLRTKTAIFTSEKLPLKYANNSIPFNASEVVRRTFLPSSDSYHPLTPDKMADFVFVTAASSNHFYEIIDSIASIQKYMPHKRIDFYDIGLKPDQITKVKSWCSVTYRFFDKTHLPKYALNLRSYAWKPIVIQQALREHSAIFWIDASFRLTGTNMSEAYRVARNNGGFVMFHGSPHSNYATTHPDMYRYLVTDVDAQKKIRQFGSGMMLIYGTKKVYRDILWWFVRCAHDAGCIVPHYRQLCKFAPHDGYTQFAMCHRFDQSAINLILSNMWLKDNRMRYISSKTFFEVLRKVTQKYKIRTCKKA